MEATFVATIETVWELREERGQPVIAWAGIPRPRDPSGPRWRECGVVDSGTEEIGSPCVVQAIGHVSLLDQITPPARIVEKMPTLNGRRWDIARGAVLSPAETRRYRDHWSAQGYWLPEWKDEKCGCNDCQRGEDCPCEPVGPAPKLRWSVSITSATRKQPTLHCCVASLLRCHAKPMVYAEPRTNVSGLSVPVVMRPSRLGVWQNYLQTAKDALERDPDADVYLIVQDDAVFTEGALAECERHLWPAENPAFVSLYTPSHYNRESDGLHRIKTKSLWGAVAIAFHPDGLRDLLKSKTFREWGKTHQKNADTAVGKAANETGRSMWFFSPSLVTHEAKHSTIGNGGNTGKRNVARVATGPIPVTGKRPRREGTRAAIALLAPGTDAWMGPSRTGNYRKVLEDAGYHVDVYGFRGDDCPEELHGYELVINHALQVPPEKLVRIARQNPHCQFVNMNHSALGHLECSGERVMFRAAQAIFWAKESPNCWYGGIDNAEAIAALSECERAISLPAPLHEIEPRGYRPPGERPVVVVAGRNDPVKNLLVQAMAVRMLGDVDLRFCVESKRWLPLFASLGIKPTMTGMLPHADWLRILKTEADIVLQVSHADACNNVAIEAMSTGVPVIGSPAIQFGDPELMVTDTGNPEAVRDAVLKALADHERFAERAARLGAETVAAANAKHLEVVERLAGVLTANAHDATMTVQKPQGTKTR